MVYRSASGICLAGALLLAGTAGGAGVPPMIYGPHAARGVPVWVSAEEAVRDGSIRFELFADWEVVTLRNALGLDRRAGAPPAGGSDTDCAAEVRMHAHYDGDGGDTSLEGVYRLSSFGVLGEVASLGEGFYGGLPATLLEIEVHESIKPDAEAWAGKAVFVAYPQARIPIGGGVFCRRAGRPGDPPAVGSRILVFSFRDLSPDQVAILGPMDEEIFFETLRGELSVPAKTPSPPGSWLELERRLRRVRGLATGEEAQDLPSSEERGESVASFAEFEPLEPLLSAERLHRVISASPPAESSVPRSHLERDLLRLALARGVNAGIVLDLNDDGVRTVSLSSSVSFDVDGDGLPEATSWTFSHSSEAFLALDLDGDGEIGSGRELFGSAMEVPGERSAEHCFAALALYDGAELGGNGDRLISAADAVWPRLLLWIDRNHDGTSQSSEITDLETVGIVAISLEYLEQPRLDGGGNVHRCQGRYVRWRARQGEKPELVAGAAESMVFRVRRDR